MSKIKYTKEILEKIVKDSVSFLEVCRKLEAPQGGNGYQSIKRKIEQFKINTSHFLGQRSHCGDRHTGKCKKLHYTEILVNKENRVYRESSKRLRRALIESGRPYVCEKCGLKPIWNGNDLTLQTDHKDGNWKNCESKNLRFLCPNCHSQTSTWCNQESGARCIECNKKISSKSKWCNNCCPKMQIGCTNLKARKVKNRPNLEIILKEIDELGYVGTGKKYGVTDNTIRKWVKFERRREAMNENKQKALEEAGWKFGNAEDFLDDVVPMFVVDLIVKKGKAVSKSEARRYIFQKCVKVNGVLVEDLMASAKVGDKIEFRGKLI